jgi:toxin HigB-1
MDFEFRNETLKLLATDKNFTAGFSPAVVLQFRKLMQAIEAAPDERVFYAMKSLHYEKLKGDRTGQSSMRLNGRWRLVVQLVKKPSGKMVAIIEIVDYH